MVAEVTGPSNSRMEKCSSRVGRGSPGGKLELLPRKVQCFAPGLSPSSRHPEMPLPPSSPCCLSTPSSEHLPVAFSTLSNLCHPGESQGPCPGPEIVGLGGGEGDPVQGAQAVCIPNNAEGWLMMERQ
jgi:hypothetical protein